MVLYGFCGDLYVNFNIVYCCVLWILLKIIYYLAVFVDI